MEKILRVKKIDPEKNRRFKRSRLSYPDAFKTTFYSQIRAQHLISSVLMCMQTIFGEFFDVSQQRS